MSERSFDDLLAQMAAIASAVNAFSSDSVQQLAFQALLRSFAGEPPEPHTEPVAVTRPRKRKGSGRPRGAAARPRKGEQDAGKAAAPKTRRAGIPTFVKDLNLRLKDKQSFKDFVAAKAPGTNHERNVASVYWLTRLADVTAVTVDHVYTCYKEVNWKVPPNLANSMAVTANKKGWLNTEDTQNLRVTVKGENLVEHDLPRKAKAA